MPFFRNYVRGARPERIKLALLVKFIASNNEAMCQSIPSALSLVINEIRGVFITLLLLLLDKTKYALALGPRQNWLVRHFCLAGWPVSLVLCDPATGHVENAVRFRFVSLGPVLQHYWTWTFLQLLANSQINNSWSDTGLWVHKRTR